MTSNVSGGASARLPKRAPVFTTDAAGAPIVKVPLANHPEPAVVDRDAYDAWQEMGLSLAWTFNASGPGHRYIRAFHPRREATGNLVTPARIIAGAGPGQRVRYRDGDRLNLRRENLYLCEHNAGHAKAREASIIAARKAQA